MPGAQVAMNGQVELVGSTYEFHGKVRTEATASQMTTGWKSLLLNAVRQAAEENGAGMELPIKVTGKGSTYDLRLDFPHDTHAPPGLTSPRNEWVREGEHEGMLPLERQGRGALLVSNLRVLSLGLSRSFTRSLMSGQPQLYSSPEPAVDRHRARVRDQQEDCAGLAAAAVAVCAGAVLCVPGRAGDGAAVVDADMGPQ